MKFWLLSTCIAAGTLACANAAFAADCGAVTIASMNWQSAEVLANVDKFILNKGFGCNADIITGDTVPTITSMVEKGEPDVAPDRILMKVDLPAPLSPRIARTSPAWMSTSTSASACRAPKRLAIDRA